MGASVVGGPTVVVEGSDSVVASPREGHAKTVARIAKVIDMELAIVTGFFK